MLTKIFLGKYQDYFVINCDTSKYCVDKKIYCGGHNKNPHFWLHITIFSEKCRMRLEILKIFERFIVHISHFGGCCHNALSQIMGRWVI